jgi:hypothetical protein
MTAPPARPPWRYSSMTEHEFRIICGMGMITSVASKWEMTGADTSREWLEVMNSNGQTYTLPYSWRVALKFVGNASTPGLFGLTYQGEEMRKTIVEIDAWERKHESERREYERLKRKFEGAPPMQGDPHP